MHARVVLGVGKGVLFREVSSVQECPHTLYTVCMHLGTYVYSGIFDFNPFLTASLSV